MEKPTFNAFSLSKVKLAKDGGLTADYEINEVVGSETYHNEYQAKMLNDLHPDLQNLFKKLRPIMANLFNVDSCKTLAAKKEFAATDEQKQLADEFANDAATKIEMRGVSFSGTDENRGVVLTGLFEFANGMKAAINSPRIKFANESFGFEIELEEICTKIEKEVYEFLFENKRAQLELFGE